MLILAVSEDCHLRQLDDGDADELHALVEANRTYLSAWMPWAAEQTAAQTADFIREARRRAADEDGPTLAIVCDDRIAGVVGCHGIDWEHGSTSLGYWLAERHQGRGIVTRAVRALVEHALDEWRLQRIEIRVATGNARSRAVARRLGFREEGVEPQAQQVAGRTHDLAVYVLRADDRPSGG